MDRITIGKMAQLNHISAQTLRLYDKMGLLKPAVTDAETGYRYYTMKQSATLDMIQYMKSLGMSLRQIKEQLEKNDIGLLKAILEKRQVQIKEEIRELKYQMRAVERTIESYERYENAPGDGAIVLEYIGKRLIYSIKTDVNFYDYDIEVYEELLRELKFSLIADRLPQIYFCNAGTIMKKEDILAGRFLSNELFVQVDGDYVEEKYIGTIPGNTYLCIYCDRFEKEKEYAKRLLNEIQEKKYRIGGDYICEVIAELPAYENHERGMYLRLQIPIIF